MKEKISTVMGRFGRFSAGVFRRPVSSHTHKEPSVLFHLGGADLAMTVDERTVTLKAGDMLLFDPWMSHSRTTVTDQPSTLATLLIEPTSLNPPNPYVAANLESDLGFSQSEARIDFNLRLQLDELVALMSDRPMARLEMIQMKIEQLIATVRVRYADPGRALREGRSQAVDFRVRRAFESLRSSAIQGVKIESLAAKSGMSRSHFFRQFKRGIGVSPQHVVDEERIAYALNALGAPGILLSKLSEELGFSAPAHFTRFFVQHLGCTPSQFRRNLLVV